MARRATCDCWKEDGNEKCGIICCPDDGDTSTPCTSLQSNNTSPAAAICYLSPKQEEDIVLDGIKRRCKQNNLCLHWILYAMFTVLPIYPLFYTTLPHTHA